MEEGFAAIIMRVSSFSIVLPALFALFKIRSGNHPQKILSILVLVAVLIEVISLVIVGKYGLNNLFLIHIFTIIEFGLLVYIYKANFKSIIAPRIYDGLIIAFTIFSISNSLFNESILEFNAFGRIVETLILIMIVLLYFYDSLQTLSDRHLESSPLFWISVGILLYFSASFFIFIYSNYLISSEDQSFTLWGVHAVMNIVLNIFNTIALWVKPKN